MYNYVKKILSLCLSVLFLLSLSGCTTSKTKLIEEDGNYYLVFKKDPPKYENGDEVVYFSVFAPELHFPSVSKLKRTIETGRFTDREMQQIYIMTRDSQGRVPIMDMSALFECETPDTLEVKDVVWYGRYYKINLKGKETDTSGGVYELSETEYQETVENLSHFDHRYTVISKTPDTQRNGTVFLYLEKETNTVKKNIVYSVTIQDKDLHISEIYDAPEADSPTGLTICGSCNDLYFTVWLSNLTEYPDTAYLSQFGIRLHGK